LADFPGSDVIIFSLVLGLPGALALAVGVALRQSAAFILNGVILAAAAGYLTLLAIGSATQGN
jgi:small-conductance mechanosensitive channel